MDALARPVIPPAPYVHKAELSTLRLMRETTRNLAGFWAEPAFSDLVARRKALGVDSVVFNDPEAVRQVLGDKAGAFGRPAAFVRPIRPLGGNGVLLAEGSDWRRQRRMLAPVFAPSKMVALTSHFDAAADGLLERAESNPRINLSEAFQDAALDAVMRALFSMPAGHHAGMAALARRYIAGAGRPSILDGLASSEDAFPLFGGPRRRFTKAWRPQVDAIVAERRGLPASDTDLLGLLLAARDPETGEPVPDAEIRDQTATMLVAGFETTARLLFWAAYLLALDPIEQDRVRADLTLDSPRLRQVLLEALRLYPPVAVLLRQAKAAVTIGGEDLNPGTLAWISPWVMHRHTRFWDHPTAFMPERFAGKPNAFLTEPAFLPFGGGPRICIGASFAMTEASILLSRLLARFHITLESDRPVLPVATVTTAPDHEPWFNLEPVA